MAHDFEKGQRQMKAPVTAIKKMVSGAGAKSYGNHSSLAGTGKPNKKGL